MFASVFKIVTGRKKKKAVDTKGFVQLDGSFFQRLDEAYLNSPTATMCLLKFHEYCVPIGLLDQHQALWKKIESDYIRYGYFVLNVQYDVDANVTGVVYKNPKDFVPKEQDDYDNVATFKNIKSGKEYPAFNSDKAIVKSQFVAGGSNFKKYTGQIYMYNDSSMPFRVTPLYSVLKWMELENDASTYVSKASDNAMFGNNIFVVKASSSDLSDTSPEATKEREILSEIKEALTEAKGVENTAQNLLLEWKGDTEDVTKLITKVSISNDVNVDLLNSVDDKAESKICVACYNFPKILLFQNDGIFGDSGLAIETAEKLWSKSCQREANNILDAFKAIGVSITKEVPADASNINTDIIGS